MLNTYKAFKATRKTFDLICRGFASYHEPHHTLKSKGPSREDPIHDSTIARTYEDTLHKHDDHHDDHHGDHHGPTPPGGFPKKYGPVYWEESDRKYDDMMEEYRHLYPEPTKKDSPKSAQMLIANNTITKSKAFLQFMAHELQFTKTKQTTDYKRLPKIHENSVQLFFSPEISATMRAHRGSEYAYWFFALFVMKMPLFVVPCATMAYTFFTNAAIYEPCRRFVIRMDLLPHLEMVHFQKVGMFGQLYSKLVRIENLEKVDIESIRTQEQWFWALNAATTNEDMIFRDKETGEYYLFDRFGHWDWKGISHELLY
jgi:hypothetical protein